MKRLLPVLLLLLVFGAERAFAAGRPMTIDDLLAVKGVSDPKVSPDGRWVVYVVSKIDKASGKTESDLFATPLAGGETRQLTTSPGPDREPVWSPDGKSIVFVSSRSGSAQLWRLPFSGGEAVQLTKLPIDVAGPVFSPKGDVVAFAGSVLLGKTAEETARADKAKAEAKSKAQTYDRLMFRHWNAWDDGKRSHVFVIDLATGKTKDLMPDWQVNVPPAPFGGSESYAFSPEGDEIAFCSEPLADLAWSTNTDLWTLNFKEASAKPVNITKRNDAADAQPTYSPDGKLFAWVSQKRSGFESDLWILNVRNRTGGETLELNAKLDRPVQSYVWGGARGKCRRQRGLVDRRGCRRQGDRTVGRVQVLIRRR